MTETEAIRARYARRTNRPPDLCLDQERNRAIDELLASLSSNRKTARVLDVGCGNGLILQHFLEIGFEPQNLAGIDLLEDRIERARYLLPQGVQLTCGDATEIDFESQNADLVLAFTVFSSVLDTSYRKTLAQRVWSAAKPGGGVLIYDFCFNNPFNKDVRALTPRQLKSLFPQAAIRSRRLTLAPPLARAAVRLSPKLYEPLSRFNFLKTHMLCWLQKPAQ